MDKMLAKVGPTGDIDQILLTGGGANLYGDYLAEKHPELKHLIRMDQDPVYSNVRGFQIYGEYARHTLA